MTAQRSRRILTRLTLLVILSSLVSGCSMFGGGSSSSGGAALSCNEVFESALQRERVGDTAGAINSEIDYLSRNCRPQFDALIGYASAKATIDVSRLESCDVWVDRVGVGAAELLWTDKLCTGESTSADSGVAPATETPGDSIPWNEAINFVGTAQRVCGPLATVRGSDDDVFLNIGRDYPDAARFVIVLWDVGGVEPIASGTTLCTFGPITYWEGIAEIELRDPGLVEIWG